MPADSNSILIFDVETTGTSADFDQIIELCAQHTLSDESTAKTWRFKPDVPIQPAAQAVHGISMEDLADSPRFADCADELSELFSTAEILVGYNVQFDLSFLLSEYNRAGLQAPELRSKKIIDPYQLWRHFEPRTLAGAHKKFVGREFESAHSATADVAATGRVLQGMLTHFGLSENKWSEISSYCPIDDQQKGWIGPSNHFLWENNQAVFGFGKHKGKTVLSVAQSDNGSYVDWMSKKSFPSHVLEIATQARKLSDAEFYQWLKKAYALE